MALELVIEEYGFELRFNAETIVYVDLEDPEPNEYTVRIKHVDKLQKKAKISQLEAALLLGTVEFIYKQTKSLKDGMPWRISTDKIIETITELLKHENWEHIYLTLKQTKYYQLRAMCEDDMPYTYYLVYLA